MKARSLDVQHQHLQISTALCHQCFWRIVALVKNAVRYFYDLVAETINSNQN